MTLTRRERRLIARLSTPSARAAVAQRLAVQHREGRRDAAQLPAGRSVSKTAHCLEAALFAAVVMEQHGYPPLRHEPRVAGQPGPRHLHLSSSSADGDRLRAHAIPDCTAASRSSDRRERLARSYIDPYVDYTGRVQAFGVANLAEAMGAYDWRCSETQRVESRADAHRLAAPQDRRARRRAIGG